jgi:class 3 adenylate cyclase
MTEPQIRYVKTSDGVNIAYSMAGSGPTLVWAPDLPQSHAALEWQPSAYGPYLEALAAEFTLVRFDARGVGLSDHDVSNFSMSARLRDLQAVVEHAVNGRFVLFGNEFSGPTAMAYTASNPATVSHLILLDTFARAALFTEHPLNKVSMELLERDWDLFVDSRTSLTRGIGDDGLRTRTWVEFYKACVTPDVERLLRPELAKDDVTELLATITTPTLILHHTGTRTRPTEMARELAAGIPGSQLMLLEGGVVGDWPRVVSAIRDFAKGAAEKPTSGTAVILFTDIVDSTPLTERMGDAAFRVLSRSIDERVRSAMRDNGGSPVDGKVLGDGVMGVFTSAAQAIAAARACAELGVELPMHIGLHAGDVTSEGNNVYGGAVNIASRICGLCEPGEILVSQTVRDLARTSAGVTFEDRGEHTLKGIADPVRVFAVRLHE